MRKFLFAAMAVLMVIGVAPAGAAELSTDTTIVEDTINTAEEIAAVIGAGAATKVPFNVVQTVPGTSVGTGYGSNSTGFVGVCDVSLECYGFSLAVSRTAGTVSASSTSVSIKGYVCVRDYTAPCGSSTSPGTGVVITDRTITGPTVSVTTPTVSVRLCTWIGDPRFGGSCPTDYIIADLDPITQTITTPGQLELFAGLIPDRIIVETP